METDRRRPGTDLAAGVVEPGLYATDPHPLFARLRAEAPVAWNEERGFWAVAKHADVTAIELRPRDVLRRPRDPRRRDRRPPTSHRRR